MVTFFLELSFGQLAWFSVINYILHYMEEGPYLVKWIKNQRPRGNLNYTQQKLNAENLLLFTLTVLFVVLLNLYPDTWIFQCLGLAPAFGFIGNTVFHALPTLRTKVYSPGVVTACILNPVMFIAYFLKVEQLGLLTWPIVLLAIIVGLLLLPAVVTLIHRVVIGNSNPGPNWLLRFPVREKSVPLGTDL